MNAFISYSLHITQEMYRSGMASSARLLVRLNGHSLCADRIKVLVHRIALVHEAAVALYLERIKPQIITQS